MDGLDNGEPLTTIDFWDFQDLPLDITDPTNRSEKS